MEDKSQRMGEFLGKAAKLIAKTENITPTSTTNIPTMNESARMLNLNTGTDTGAPVGQIGNTNPKMNTNTKLPSSILESLTSNPIAEYQGQMGGVSVLDNLRIVPPSFTPEVNNVNNGDSNYYEDGEKPLPDISEEFKKLRNRKGLISKQSVQMNEVISSSNNQQMNSSIDYNLISALLKTVVAEEFKILKDTLLEEMKNGSADGNVIIKVGNGIQFITNKGNLYEGKLKLVGNVKKID